MVSVYTRSPATHRSRCMTSIDARRATRPSAMPFVSIVLKPAMLDMKWSSLGMTGMLKCHSYTFLCFRLGHLMLVTSQCSKGITPIKHDYATCSPDLPYLSRENSILDIIHM